MNTHAQVPTVLVKHDRIRVYFATRPRPDLSLTTFVDLSLDLKKELYLHRKPILERGKKDSFDENGIMPDCVIDHNDLVYLYYSGWQNSKNFPYQNYCGLAISNDGGITFKKCDNNPILNRSESEPYSASSCFVHKHHTDWMMFYSSGTSWLHLNKKLEHNFDIKEAHSINGKQWKTYSRSIVPQAFPEEAIARPSLIKLGKVWYLFFCYRGSRDFRDGKDSYRIGYAVSHDLKHWTRSGVDVLRTVSSDWDKKMQAYPYCVNILNKPYLFYNGNYFGKNGFGCAEIKLKD